MSLPFLRKECTSCKLSAIFMTYFCLIGKCFTVPSLHVLPFSFAGCEAFLETGNELYGTGKLSGIAKGFVYYKSGPSI